MPESVTHSPLHASDLPALLATVVAARLRLEDGRHVRSAPYPEAVAARTDLLAALEAYVGALALTGRPMPYRLRDELFLYRRISRPSTSWSV